MSVSEKLGVKKSNFIGLIIVAAAVVYGIIQFILNYIDGAFFTSTTKQVLSIAIIVIYALILFFTFWGYKIPNGKMLKYVYILFAFKVGIQAASNAAYGNYLCFYLCLAAVILLAFMGGRLPRVKENKFTGALVLVLLLIVAIIVSIDGGRIYFDSVIQAAALLAAYFSRATQYKENSGILDDK